MTLGVYRVVRLSRTLGPVSLLSTSIASISATLVFVLMARIAIPVAVLILVSVATAWLLRGVLCVIRIACAIVRICRLPVWIPVLIVSVVGPRLRITLTACLLTRLPTVLITAPLASVTLAPPLLTHDKAPNLIGVFHANQIAI